MSDDNDIICCPLTGEAVPVDDVDKLLECYERIAVEDAKLWRAKNDIRLAIGQLAHGTTKTRRVRGKAWQCVVEMPDITWDQTILKEAWNSFDHLRDEFLKIDTIGVRKREFKKLLETAGPDDLMTFLGMLVKAQRPPTGLPRITIDTKPAPVEQQQEQQQENLF